MLYTRKTQFYIFTFKNSFKIPPLNKQITIFCYDFTIFNQKNIIHVYLKTKYIESLAPSGGVAKTRHRGQENLKKSRQKNSWNQINQKKIFVKFLFWQFSELKNWFLKLQKMEFGQKNYSWNWFIWFHEFFWPGLF